MIRLYNAVIEYDHIEVIESKLEPFVIQFVSLKDILREIKLLEKLKFSRPIKSITITLDDPSED